MKRICCKCGKFLGEKEGPKDMVTHGYCDTCLKNYMAEIDALGKTEKGVLEKEARCG